MKNETKLSKLGSKNKLQTNTARIKFIVCEVILDEIKERLPKEWEVVSFEKKLHQRSENLRQIYLIMRSFQKNTIRVPWSG